MNGPAWQVRVLSPSVAELARKFLEGMRNSAGPPALDGDTPATRNRHMPRQATLYRMILPDHTCPFGVRARGLLEQHGFDIDEHILGSREEVDAFKEEHGVATTPQIFIDGERIGGSEELARYLADQPTGA